MEKRIKEKIEEINVKLVFLMEIIPDNIGEYKSDLKTKAACERYVEIIVESLVDLAFLVLRLISNNQKIRTPENDQEVFQILKEERVITEDLCEKLQDAKGMRNIIAHEYGEVNDLIIYEAITNELERDVKEFINSVEKIIKLLKK